MLARRSGCKSKKCPQSRGSSFSAATCCVYLALQPTRSRPSCLLGRLYACPQLSLPLTRTITSVDEVGWFDILNARVGVHPRPVRPDLIARKLLLSGSVVGGRGKLLTVRLSQARELLRVPVSLVLHARGASRLVGVCTRRAERAQALARVLRVVTSLDHDAIGADAHVRRR